MAAIDGSEASVPDVTVKFITSFDTLRVPGAPLALPGNLTQLGLSKVVNHLLGREEGAETTFEFFLPATAPEGSTANATPRTFLRNTLIEYLAANGVSSEATVSLEYVPAMQPPKPGPSKPMPEWVSSLTATERFIVAGLSNGTLAIVSANSQDSKTATKSLTELGPLLIPAHVGNVTGVHALELAASQSVVASAGDDFVVRLWQPSDITTTAKPAWDTPVTLHNYAELVGNDGACSTVAIAPSAEHVACGDASGSVRVWRMPAPPTATTASDTSRPAKRARKMSATEEKPAPVSVDAAFTFERTHNAAVNAVAWVSSSQFATCSWDHTIKVFDIEDGAAELVTLRSPKPINCLSASPLGSLLVTGHTDCTLRVWDSRGRSSNDTSAAAKIEGLKGTARAGSGWVSAVAWCPTSSYHVLQGNHDGSVAVWDIRSLTSALFNLEKHDGKALSVCWGGADAMLAVSGGSDNKLRTNKMQASLS